MKNIWIKMQEDQRKLDEHIFDNNKQTRENTYKQRCIAFNVEFGELLNEIKEFKFWSHKPKSHKDIILEEYVDGIHFLLSISYDLNIKFSNFLFQDFIIKEAEIFDFYNEIFKLTGEISLKKDITLFEKLFNLYISIGKYQGYTLDDIYNKYYYKNNINYKRQDNGY